jgi:hypothetical protein
MPPNGPGDYDLESDTSKGSQSCDSCDMVLIAVGPTKVFNARLNFLREIQPDYWSCLNQFRILTCSYATSEGRDCEVQENQTSGNPVVVSTSINLHLRTIAAAIYTVIPQALNTKF